MSNDNDNDSTSFSGRLRDSLGLSKTEQKATEDEGDEPDASESEQKADDEFDEQVREAAALLANAAAGDHSPEDIIEAVESLETADEGDLKGDDEEMDEDDDDEDDEESESKSFEEKLQDAGVVTQDQLANLDAKLGEIDEKLDEAGSLDEDDVEQKMDEKLGDFADALGNELDDVSSKAETGSTPSPSGGSAAAETDLEQSVSDLQDKYGSQS